MAATVTFPDKPPRTVKNLGWLLRHQKEVQGLYVTVPVDAKSTECTLIADLTGGGEYRTPFASRSILALWLRRPVFQGLPLVWFGEKGAVGKPGGGRVPGYETPFDNQRPQGER